jgi:siroheme synthase
VALARPNQTVVVYMGVGTLATTARQLVAHGRAADTPAAIVERATTCEQRVTAGTLATLPDLAKARAVKPPALVIIGEVVALRDRLGWFDASAVAKGPLDRAIEPGRGRAGLEPAPDTADKGFGSVV